jgi:hypothetical protein
MVQKAKQKIQQRQKSPHTAEEKCKAVLSIWSERRKPAEVCKELSIKWAQLSHWQSRALEGMLQALQPRVNLEKGPALSSRMQILLEKRLGKVSLQRSQDRLSIRLQKLQKEKAAEKTPQESKEKTL